MRQAEVWIGRISLAIGSAVLVAMMLQVVVDVFLRSFVGIVFPATADLVGRYYMVAVSFLPLAMTEIDRRHIEATIFTHGLTGAAKTAVFFLGFLAGLVVFGLLIWGSFNEAMIQSARGAYLDVGTMRFPTWPSYWILPVSFALMEAIMVIRLVELLTGRFVEGDHDPSEEVQGLGPETR
ncbi:TRAP transporter small permease [Jiella avicenniae]|uniref:TRAP transporter small permease protein n=1 Tax=Jiella avicenniae TaxID=2907202 RepID=A0A9X1T6V5_9HYPH|nr:TRAP transporter small permease [Jiella avicenniae]MCE7030612.1 TRAP transporter small permease [Jiella avicenniae]